VPETRGRWPGELFGASWSPDGREIVACNFDGRIQVRDGASGALLRETLRPGMLFVQFDRDGGSRILASAYASNRGMEMLDAATLEPLWTSKQTSHLWPVLSPTGERVFSASWLGYLGVWDARTGRLVAEIEGLPPGNPRVGVSPDGVRGAGGGRTCRSSTPGDPVGLARRENAPRRRGEDAEGAVKRRGPPGSSQPGLEAPETGSSPPAFLRVFPPRLPRCAWIGPPNFGSPKVDDPEASFLLREAPRPPCLRGAFGFRASAHARSAPGLSAWPGVAGC
jgi:hypothetical protein